MKSVFEFDDYKAFLRSVEESRGPFERGFRSRLAKSIGCQSGYISHVLNSLAHLSLEQALRAGSFLKLNEKEQKFFFALIERQRAGTPELTEHFSQEIRRLREEHFNIRERVGPSKVLSEADQSTYYSSWHFVAVHVAASLPGLQSVRTIASALSLPEQLVREVVLFLLEKGILTGKDSEVRPGLTQIHLGRQSPMIRQHHTNLRMAAIQSLAFAQPESVHYSTLSTMSKADAQKLRAEMIALIERYVATVKPSQDEVLYGFNLDFYSILKSS